MMNTQPQEVTEVKTQGKDALHFCSHLQRTSPTFKRPNLPPGPGPVPRHNPDLERLTRQQEEEEIRYPLHHIGERD